MPFHHINTFVLCMLLASAASSAPARVVGATAPQTTSMVGPPSSTQPPIIEPDADAASSSETHPYLPLLAGLAAIGLLVLRRSRD